MCYILMIIHWSQSIVKMTKLRINNMTDEYLDKINHVEFAI